MKSIGFVLFLLASTTIYAQEDVRKNEIGMDVTGLWELVLGSQNFNQNDYFITYRRYFADFNLTSGIGFQYENLYSDIPDQVNTDSRRNKVKRNFNYRIGIEKEGKVFKKIQTFYGVYYTQSFSHHFDDLTSVSGGFARGQVNNISQSGLAPFIGVRYNLTDRIGIETSSFINFYYELNKTEQFSRYVGPIAGTPPLQYVIKRNSWNLSNQLPIFLIFTIKV